MSDGYTKLFSSILVSSIWAEPDHVRIVWITMLAMADQHGTVDASIPGLAKMANKSIEETQSALSVLLSPDEYSRSKDLDGCRIVETDGGWEIVNYLKYRGKASLDDRKKKTAARVRRYRERKRAAECNGQSVTPALHGVTCNKSNDIAEADAEADAEAERGNIPPTPLASIPDQIEFQTPPKTEPPPAQNKPKSKRKAKAAPYEAMQLIWNTMASAPKTGYAISRVISVDRKRKMGTRYNNTDGTGGLLAWIAVIEALGADEWWREHSKEKWATIDGAMQASKWTDRVERGMSAAINRRTWWIKQLKEAGHDMAAAELESFNSGS